MLVIKNYKKIKNQYFGDWQVGKIEELKECYAMQVWNVNSRKSITLIILRDGEFNDGWGEMTYPLSLVEDGAGNSNIIEDIVYKNTLEDMEMFGESLVHYLNSL
jgi:hypothetical protein